MTGKRITADCTGPEATLPSYTDFTLKELLVFSKAFQHQLTDL